MGLASTYLSVVAAGALTAGVAATGVVVTPDMTETVPAVADVELNAITIPLLDVDQTVGPLTVIQQILLTLGGDANRLFTEINSKSQTIYDLPGLYTNYSNGGQTIGELVRNPGESIGAGLQRTIDSSSEWSLLGVLGNALGSSGGSAFDLTGFTGGTEGIGVGLGGTLSNSQRDRQLTFFNSGLDSEYDGTFADGGGQLSFMPFDGFKAVGDATVIDVRTSKTSLKLGSLQVAGSGDGALGGGAGLCLGSAAGTDGCGPSAGAFASFRAPIQAGFGTGGSTTSALNVNIPTNLAVSIGKPGFSLTGDLGGTVSVGSVELGRVIPVNIQIPGASSLAATSGKKQTSAVRDSFRATPKSLSDNATGGRHRLSDRVGEVQKDVKTAVDNVAKAVKSTPKHAAED